MDHHVDAAVAWLEMVMGVVEVRRGICISAKMLSTSFGCPWEWQRWHAQPRSSTESFELGMFVAIGWLAGWLAVVLTQIYAMAWK
jgi:cytochrome c biogenesis protein CcdA